MCFILLYVIFEIITSVCLHILKFLNMDNMRKAAILTYLIPAAVLLIKNLHEKKKERKTRRWGIRPIFQKRLSQGDYNNLFKEMRFNDHEMFFNYTRMNLEMFDFLISLVGPHLKQKSKRPSISAGERLAVTLRILADGSSYSSASFAFRLGKSTVCEIFKETCEILWDVLEPLYLKPPNEETYEEIINDFYNKWQLPNCAGALDGKHVAIKAPNNSGSSYYNYKKHFSVVLFAVCDSEYMFTHVDIGSYGAQSDGGILKESNFGKALNNNLLEVPSAKYLPGTSTEFPIFFVGDEAFPLQTNLMKPYSGKYLEDSRRIFNYRLSRGRRCIENAFGILAARWRIFHKTIYCFPETVDNIIKATVCLHNFVKVMEKKRNRYQYCNVKYVDNEDPLTGEICYGEWRNELPSTCALNPTNSVRRLGTRNAKHNSIHLRDKLKDYFMSNAGKIPWQENSLK